MDFNGGSRVCGPLASSSCERRDCIGVGALLPLGLSSIFATFARNPNRTFQKPKQEQRALGPSSHREHFC
jgi:hypothetical protein